MSEHLPKTEYLDPEVLQRLGDLELIARKVVAGRHTISFIVGADAGESNYALRGVNLIDNVKINAEE